MRKHKIEQTIQGRKDCMDTHSFQKVHKMINYYGILIT